MSYYYWNRETDVLTKAKYDFMTSPRELWESEMLDLSRNLEENLRVGEAYIRDFWISTVFLGMDHNHLHMGSPPICFETMILDYSTAKKTCDDWYQKRYSTGTKARKEHDRLVKLSRKLLLNAPQISRKNYSKVMNKL